MLETPRVSAWVYDCTLPARVHAKARASLRGDMPRYEVMQVGDQLFVELPYINFAAVGIAGESGVPRQVVPLFRSIGDALEAIRPMAVHHERLIASAGGLRRIPDAGLSTAYDWKMAFPFTFFRGVPDMRYDLMPSRYRFRSPVADPRLAIRDRVAFETACAEKIQARWVKAGTTETTLDQARAAARHFGAASGFLDFSFSPDVAAFFGHPDLSDGERREGPPFGLIYCLNVEWITGLFGGINGWKIGPAGSRELFVMNAVEKWALPFCLFDRQAGKFCDNFLHVGVPDALRLQPLSIRTCVVPGVRRIVGQQGLFLEASLGDPEDLWAQALLWTVLDFLAVKVCYFRGESQYENAAAGVTHAALFPAEDAALTELTADFSAWA